MTPLDPLSGLADLWPFLNAQEKDEAAALIQPRLTRFIPHRPHPKQSLFLELDCQEAMYGGAAGGGKTDALLMGALQYVDVPGYAALILMRTYADLSLPKAGISRSKEWLHGTGAHWSGETKTWTFPTSGAPATLTFGYLENEADKFRYRTAEFQYIAFDELTRFSETQYRYMFSRLRRLMASAVPTRMRAGTNPGDVGHEWVRKRFVPDEFVRREDEGKFDQVWEIKGRAFVPARMEDNPALDRENYELALDELDPVTRAQYKHGDWAAAVEGRFKRDWFKRSRYRDGTDHWRLLDTGEIILKRDLSHAVMLDPANRKTKTSKKTAMVNFADLGQDRLLVIDALNEQLDVEQIVPTLDAFCARRYGTTLPPDWCGIEANGFQMMLVEQARKRREYPSIPVVNECEPEGKSKLTRVTPAIILAEQGRIYLPEDGPHCPEWLEPFLDQLCRFTGDDKVDAYTDLVDCLGYYVRERSRIVPKAVREFRPFTVGGQGR